MPSFTREPHIVVRRTSTHHDDEVDLADWYYSIVVGGRKHTGVCKNVSFGEVWRQVRRVMRRSSKYVWVQLTPEERETYGLINAQPAGTNPPPPAALAGPAPGGFAKGGIVSKEVLTKINEP